MAEEPIFTTGFVNEPYRLPLSSHPQAGYASQICKWISACNSSHGAICRAEPISLRDPEDVPLWLIDTHQQCIVPGVSADRYLALSYVWPETRDSSTPAPRTLLLDSANMESFQVPQFLSSVAIAPRIPAVIRHAMEVTIAIGERYLWVDRLCILQNDQGTLSEVAKMDQVYAGAYMTIVAAAPDKMYEDALSSEWPAFQSERSKGRGRNSRPHPKAESSSASLELGEQEAVKIMRHRYGILTASRWATRGWTYQEQILCKRAAIFTKRGVFWDCQCCMWDGIDLLPGQSFQSIPLRADMGMRFSTRWWPDFGFYVDLICPYNGREFSYPQDALLGISGVLNALTGSFPGGFISGIPRVFLDHALLWQPFGTADRRVDRHEDPDNIVDSGQISSLPSWSWCGWQCFVDPWSLRSGLAYLDEPQYQARAGSWRTTNLVNWGILGEQGQPDPVLEPNTFDHNVGQRSIIDATLPKGWTRHSVSETDPLHFTHEMDKDFRFKHPIPLQEDSSRRQDICFRSHLMLDSTTSTALLPATVLVYGRENSSVSRGAAKISAFEDEIFSLGPKRESSSPILVLQQTNGAFGGLLRLMDKDLIDADTPMEFIAISAGSATAQHLRASLEWKVFESGEVRYRSGNHCRTVVFQPQWLEERGKRALLFDLAMAFDQEAAGHGDLASEFDDLVAEVNDRSQVKWKMSPSNTFKALAWFRTRIDILQELSVKDRDSPATANNALCEFYNVLWIERKNGVAYRRACGWVPKHVWEAHASGLVRTKLG